MQNDEKNIIKFLTYEHIITIHQKIIEESGGLGNGCYIFIRDKIESILAQQFPHFGFDKYPSLFQKAAMLMYFFIKGHCFTDGNKRIGIQSAIVFLKINGYIDQIPEQAGYAKTMHVASTKVPEDKRDDYIDELAAWLYENFIKNNTI